MVWTELRFVIFSVSLFSFVKVILYPIHHRQDIHRSYFKRAFFLHHNCRLVNHWHIINLLGHTLRRQDSTKRADGCSDFELGD